MTTHFVGDTALLTGRSLRHITRSLDTIITTTIMPIAFLLLFVFVLGGAIDTGSDSYVDYLLPGILVITVASGVSYTAYRLFLDLQSGIFERFHSMPIARSSVLWAHVLTSWPPSRCRSWSSCSPPSSWASARGQVLARAAVAGILALFTLALTWLAVIPGLTAKSVDGASAFSYPLILLPFISLPSCPPPRCPARCAPSPRTSRSPPSSTRSATCSHSSRSAPTSGSPLPGASGFSSSPTRSRCSSTAAGSPELTSGPGGLLDGAVPDARRRPGARGDLTVIRRRQWTHHRGGSSSARSAHRRCSPEATGSRTDRTTCPGGRTRPAPRPCAIRTSRSGP